MPLARHVSALSAILFAVRTSPNKKITTVASSVKTRAQHQATIVWRLSCHPRLAIFSLLVFVSSPDKLLSGHRAAPAIDCTGPNTTLLLENAKLPTACRVAGDSTQCQIRSCDVSAGASAAATLASSRRLSESQSQLSPA